MTEQEMKRAIEAMTHWRITEREMIANKTAFTMQMHSLAKRHAREIADELIKRGSQP